MFALSRPLKLGKPPVIPPAGSSAALSIVFVR
jgi:hypothetical protein